MTLNRRCFTTSLALAALSLRSNLARAERGWEALKVGYYEIPPYLQMVDGKLTGLLFDTWSDLTARVGVAYVPVSLPPARLVRSLADGDIDVSLTPITFPEFIGRTLFSKLPAANIILEAYNFWPAPKLESLRDLNGRSVILQQGFGYGGLINYVRAPENRITVARKRYIDAVREYNIIVRSFPSNLTAMVFGMKEKAQFTVENEKEISKAPKVDFGKPAAPSVPSSPANEYTVPAAK